MIHDRTLFDLGVDNSRHDRSRDRRDTGNNSEKYDYRAGRGRLLLKVDHFDFPSFLGTDGSDPRKQCFRGGPVSVPGLGAPVSNTRQR